MHRDIQQMIGVLFCLGYALGIWYIFTGCFMADFVFLMVAPIFVLYPLWFIAFWLKRKYEKRTSGGSG